MIAKIPVKRAGKESPGPHFKPRESHGTAIENHGIPRATVQMEKNSTLGCLPSSWLFVIQAIRREKVCSIHVPCHQLAQRKRTGGSS